MRYYELLENKILDEMPMPVDWDKSIYKPHVSYAKRIKYAAERAVKLGKGSSRSAFLITIDGKESVLKVAHNAKGMAQNAVEADVLSDGYIQKIGITIPMIDYDEEHREPLWINLERATKVSEKALCKIMCCDNLGQIVEKAMYSIGQKVSWNFKPNEIESQIEEKYGERGLETFIDYSNMLADLGNYDIQLGDFERAANWGIFNGKPVVVDLGFNSNVKSAYYS